MSLNFSGGFFDSVGGGISDLFGSSGLKKEAASYQTASKFATRNAKLAGVSTALEVNQADRQINKILGGQKADVAGAGFAQSGSAVDLLSDSTSQGELTKQLMRTQGLITQTGYQAEAAAYTGQAQAASAAAKGKTASGLGGLISAGITLFGLSDRRLKENIIFLQMHKPTGLRLYEFNYIGQPEKWCGVIAQEVMEKYPHAVVVARDGYLRVNYGTLGFTPFIRQHAAA